MRPPPRSHVVLGLVALLSWLPAGCAAPPLPTPSIAAAIMVDFSGSFAPLQAGDKDALAFITSGLSRIGERDRRRVRVYWSIIGERSDSSGRPCPDVSLGEPTLIQSKKSSGTDFETPEKFRIALGLCVEAIVSQSARSKQRATDIADAFIRASQTLSGPGAAVSPTQSEPEERIVFALSDFVQDGAIAQPFAPHAFKGFKVLLLYRGKSTTVEAPGPTTEPWTIWEKRLQESGANLAPSMKVGALDEQKVIDLFQ